MAFTATPQDGSSPTPIPMSSAVPDGTNTPLAIEGGPSITTGGNTLVPVSMYVKDGNDIAQGTSTDAANVSSVIGQLKQIKTNTTLGSATSANSLPVVVASDQASIGVIEPCIVSTVNSSTATLTANSVFTGTSESALPFSAISVEVFADQASAAGGLSIQQSQNGTNWDTVDAFSVVASTAFNTTVNLIGQFYRVVYTNGGTNQGTFRLQTIKQPVDVVLPRTLTALGNLKTSLQEVNGAALSLGQATMAASLPVTLASNQPTQNVAVSAALPTGANTIGAVTQASGPWTNNITQVSGSAITLGSKISASSLPVVIASDQGSMPMTIQATSGTALAADQTNSELRVSNYVTKTTAGDTALTLGSATSANSLPVVIASDQAAFTTNQGASAAAGIAWRIKGDFTEQATLSAAALNADLVPSTDVSAYKWASLQIATVATGGVVTFQGSNDNSTWNSVSAYSIDGIGALFTTTSTAKIYAIPISFRFLRVRQTAWTSGSTTGTLELYTSPLAFTPGIQPVSQNGTWTVQPGNIQNTTPWLTVGPTSNGSQTANTAGSTVLKASAGYLWSATVTATGTAELDIYDNAASSAGLKLLAIPASATVGSIYSFPGGARAANGITSGGVTNCPGVTFYWS